MFAETRDTVRRAENNALIPSSSECSRGRRGHLSPGPGVAREASRHEYAVKTEATISPRKIGCPQSRGERTLNGTTDTPRAPR